MRPREALGHAAYVAAIDDRGCAVSDRVYIAEFDGIAIYFTLGSHGDR
jgi:hypothetical protein